MSYYVEWPTIDKDGDRGAILFPICKTLTDVAKYATRTLDVFGEKWKGGGKDYEPGKYLTIFKNKRTGPELLGYYELVDGKLKKAGTWKLTEWTVVK